MAIFLLNSDVNPQVGRLLVAAGHDSLTTRNFGLVNAPDHLVLACGAENKRIVVTHNVEDFRMLHRAWRDWPTRWGSPVPPPNHSGVIAIPHHPDAARTSAAVIAIEAGYDSWVNRAICWDRKSRNYDVHTYP